MAEKAALLILAAVLLINIYAASVHSFTSSESRAYINYSSKPLLQIFTLPYTADHQVLHDALCYVVVQMFRVTEFWLRLPGLLGGVLFFAAVYRICHLLFGSSLRFLATLLVLTLNPFTLNYLSRSTGVGMAAGFYLLALEQLSRILLDPLPLPAAPLWRASIALGLAVAFQFEFALPGIGLVLAFLHCQFWRSSQLPGWLLLNNLVVPGVLVGFAFEILPLVRATRASLLAGAGSAKVSAQSILNPASAGIPFTAVLIAVGALTLWCLIRSRRAPEQIISGTLLLSSALGAALHWTVGMGYPEGPGAFPYAFLVPLLISACAHAEPGWFGTLFPKLALAVALLALCAFVWQLPVTLRGRNRPETGINKVARALRDQIRRTGNQPAAVGISPELKDILEFYRHRYPLGAVRQVTGIQSSPAPNWVISLPSDQEHASKGRKALFHANQITLFGAVE